MWERKVWGRKWLGRKVWSAKYGGAKCAAQCGGAKWVNPLKRQM